MKPTLTLLVLATAFGLSACNRAAPPAADSATPADAAAAPAAPVAGADPVTPPTSAEATQPGMPGMTPEQHAAMDAANANANSNTKDPMAGMDHGDMKGMEMGAQAGWYQGGTFQACGSKSRLKVGNTAEIDSKIKAAGMQSSDPVYVRVEGKASGTAFDVSRVVQVGSPTPVRDCAMTGMTMQGG